MSIGDWAKTDCRMTMLNQFGQVVLQLNFGKDSLAMKRISIDKMANGLYFLRFEAVPEGSGQGPMRAETRRIVVGRDY